jgi:hypothetical protein
VQKTSFQWKEMKVFFCSFPAPPFMWQSCVLLTIKQNQTNENASHYKPQTFSYKHTYHPTKGIALYLYQINFISALPSTFNISCQAYIKKSASQSTMPQCQMNSSSNLTHTSVFSFSLIYHSQKNNAFGERKPEVIFTCPWGSLLN